jgi:hypothetical protein
MWFLYGWVTLMIIFLVIQIRMLRKLKQLKVVRDQLLLQCFGIWISIHASAGLTMPVDQAITEFKKELNIT